MIAAVNITAISHRVAVLAKRACHPDRWPGEVPRRLLCQKCS
jgi:hypothetical protein